MIYLYFFVGFLLGTSISLLLIFVTSLREKFFSPLLENLSNKLKVEAEKTLEDIEELKEKKIDLVVGKKEDQAKGAMEALVKNESEALKELISEANKALIEAKTTWKTQNDASLKGIRDLNDGFIRWQNSLTNPIKQGSESEMALESLLNTIGFVENLTYKTQTQKKNADGKILKPDIFVKTKGNRWFVIDSKAPMTAFNKMVQAETEKEKSEHLKELSNNFKSHIKDLGKKKYEELDSKSPPFTVMFVPNAALYLSVMNSNENEILELSRRNNVFITPPAMMIPILQMFNEGLLEEEFEIKKDNFRGLIEKLIEAIGYLDEHFINAEKGIDKAHKSLINFRNSWNKYLPSRSREIIESQKLDVKEISQLESFKSESDENVIDNDN